MEFKHSKPNQINSVDIGRERARTLCTLLVCVYALWKF